MNERTRAIVSAIVLLIIEAAGIFGVTLDESLVTTIVGLVLIVAGLVYGVWKNHNFTDFAGMCQQLLKAMKDGDEEIIGAVKELIEKINKAE